MVNELNDEYGLFIDGWMHACSIDEALEMTRTWVLVNNRQLFVQVKSLAPYCILCTRKQYSV